jgi:hypothetical protein
MIKIIPTKIDVKRENALLGEFVLKWNKYVFEPANNSYSQEELSEIAKELEKFNDSMENSEKQNSISPL